MLQYDLFGEYIEPKNETSTKYTQKVETPIY
jgi:hypothetical protein